MAPALDLREVPAAASAAGSHTISARRAILILGPIRFALKELEGIKALYDVETVPCTDHQGTSLAISAAVKSRKLRNLPPFEACVWGFGNGPYSPFDEGLLGSAAAEGAKFFSGGGVGYDDVDVKWMTSIGAYYSNTPTSVRASTATGALMLILMATRAATWAEQNVRKGWWRGENMSEEKFLPLGWDVEGSRLGIVGMGGIGKELALRAMACGLDVCYHNRREVPEAESLGIKYLSMDELLATSDIISLNCPLTDSTRHLIDSKAFAKMKDGVFISNSARGAVIDEAALVDALKSGKVSRVGLDVFEQEPSIHPGLLDPEISHRVTMQPHSAARTQQTIHKGEIEILKNLAQFMRGEKPQDAVNTI
ncbi:hypothetical protein T439DRAFT_316390 [Meredithblackwellia eburnea MCA 4105]